MLNKAKVCVHWEKIILCFQVAFNYSSFSKCLNYFVNFIVSLLEASNALRVTGSLSGVAM